MIRPVTADDLGKIAQIHKMQFHDHYLGKFSPQLIGKFYKEYLSEESLIFLVCQKSAAIEGFVLGGFSDKLNACSRTFLKSHVINYTFEILCRPAVWLDTGARIKNILKNRYKKSNVHPSAASFRLLSISVTKELQGKEAAKALVLAFEKAIPHHINIYGLSVHANNARAIGFYQKMGFIKEREVKGSIYMIKNIR